AGERLRQLARRRNVAQPALALGYEHAAIGKKGHRPWMGEALGNRRHMDPAVIRRAEGLVDRAGGAARAREQHRKRRTDENHMSKHRIFLSLYPPEPMI